jgi:serine/threonine protein phosphatase PrpC
MTSSKSPTENLCLKWSGLSDRGRVRKNNEDAFVGLHFDANEVHRLGKFGEGSLNNGDFAFAVSDGMGGANAGEFASQIVVEKITKLLPRSFQQSAIGLESGFQDVMAELFDQTHKQLTYVGNSYEECSGMEATLSLCWFAPNWMYFGHIGDSRIYYISAREGSLKQLTHDDTHVGWLFRNGKINEREAHTHPRRRALQKALGGGNQFVEPQVGAVGYEKGDIFLLCTDGLVEGLYNEQLVEILRSDELNFDQLGSHLVMQSLEKGSKDNSTALVVKVV